MIDSKTFTNIFTRWLGTPRSINALVSASRSETPTRSVAQPDVREWISRPRRIQFHFTPTYSSWLNQVEIWFGILMPDVLTGGVWTSKST
jgi:hypothetical protein